MLSSLEKWRVICALSSLRSGRSVLPQIEPYYNHLSCFGLTYNTASRWF